MVPAAVPRPRGSSRSRIQKSKQMLRLSGLEGWVGRAARAHSAWRLRPGARQVGRWGPPLHTDPKLAWGLWLQHGDGAGRSGHRRPRSQGREAAVLAGEVGSSPGFEEAQVETECWGEFTVKLSISPGPAPARPRPPCQGGAAAGRLESQLPGQPARVGYSPRPQGTGFTGLSPAPPLPLPRPLTLASLVAQC